MSNNTGNAGNTEPGSLGIWLQKELDRRGLTERGAQSKLARAAGLHPSVISRVLSGGRGMEMEQLRRLGGALGYTLGQMLIVSGMATREDLALPDEAGDDDGDVALPRYPDDPVLQHLWDTPDPDLTDEQRGALVQMYQAIRRVATAPDGRSATRRDSRTA